MVLVYRKLSLLWSIMLFGCFVFAQDYKEFIPDYSYKQYSLPDSTFRVSSFSMSGDITVSVPIRQGIYNANLGLWTVMPGSGIMSYFEDESVHYYLRSDSTATALDLVSRKDTVFSRLVSIDFGNFRMKKAIGYDQILIYGQDKGGTKIYSYQEGKLTTLVEQSKPVYDLIATSEQILFTSPDGIYSITNGEVEKLLSTDIPVTGISYGPNQSLFISSPAGVLWVEDFNDKKPEVITKALNGIIHYQSDTLFLLDFLTNSIFRIEVGN